ncbi:hypothetical protein [Hyphomicrobium sp. CS1GBMeth3]|uniref:hypothetical protein n=1 Tax=Hyphomicrobium sp. CS1GBMeth3 TaxID=1892845 RepID=UPI001114D9C4|nr:hypothetical protein [Hyphomicrobium sp. CS1GBMeth3]
MSQPEIDLFSSFLRASASYFEFGMGGSTCLAASLVKSHVYSVDSDVSWIDRVREEVAESATEVSLIHVDIGPTGAWGTPINRNMAHLFDAYSLAITRPGFPPFDLCLVDGRFRVACFLQAILHLDACAVVGIHDYTVRPHYHVVEEFARPIAASGQLVFFVKRKNADPKALKKVLDAHRRVSA